MTFMNLLFLAGKAQDITWGEAGANTAMGLGIVFITLAFISLIISLEGKILSKVGSGKKAKPVTVSAPEPESEPEESDDLGEEEIAAVISAAIYAYESENGGSVPSDGLVVRSIRRIRCAR